MRNYRKEYDSYQGTEKQKKNRAARNKARREAVADGRCCKGDGRDVGHKRTLKSGGSNAKSNTKIQSIRSNRSEGGKIGNRKGKARGGRIGGKK